MTMGKVERKPGDKAGAKATSVDATTPGDSKGATLSIPTFFKKRISLMLPYKSFSRNNGNAKSTAGEPNPKPNLHKLPAEILLLISEHLLPSSIACLAFTHPTIYYLIDHAPFLSLKSEFKPYMMDYRLLLKRLRCDSKDYINCTTCISLHDKRIPPLTIDSYLSTTHYDDTKKSEVGDFTEILLQLRAPRLNHAKQRKAPVFTLLRGHIELAFQRYHRAPGTNHNRGICVQRLRAHDLHDEKFPAESSKELKGRKKGGGKFTAQFSWDAACRIRHGNFVTLQCCRIRFSTPLIDESDEENRYTNVRRALRCMDLSCCEHCNQSGVIAEVVCKLNQWTRKTKNCVSLHRQPEYRCGEHVHPNCTCAVDFEVLMRGESVLEVNTWILWGSQSQLRPSGMIKSGSAKNAWERDEEGWRCEEGRVMEWTYHDMKYGKWWVV